MLRVIKSEDEGSFFNRHVEFANCSILDFACLLCVAGRLSERPSGFSWSCQAGCPAGMTHVAGKMGGRYPLCSRLCPYSSYGAAVLLARCGEQAMSSSLIPQDTVLAALPKRPLNYPRQLDTAGQAQRSQHELDFLQFRPATVYRVTHSPAQWPIQCARQVLLPERPASKAQNSPHFHRNRRVLDAN